MTKDQQFTTHTLGNGLRVVIERMPDVRSAAAGFLARTGARDETPTDAGISHFLEHMMFKGTPKRSWQEITVAFDRMGSTYNAFTSEDRTVYYGWVPSRDIDQQIELLADMMRSTIPAEELTTEKKVVLEEIAMSKDSLDHQAFDFLQEKVFADHPLAWPILGYDRTVESMHRDQMLAYFQERYAPNNLTLIVTGDVDPGHIVALAEKLCGNWVRSNVERPRSAPKIHAGVDTMTLDRYQQQIIALTFPAASGCSDLAETAGASATILGDDNSRFYWNIVQAGISPRAGVHYLEYTDCGVMILYGMCQPENAERLFDAMRADAQRICEQPVEDYEIERVRNKRRTSLAIESEVPYHRLTQIMDDLEYHDRPRTVEERLADVESITAASIQEYFAKYPINADGHLTSVGPREWPADSPRNISEVA